ncbi:MAG: class I SAM-dependent methyltransferase [Bacteroidota bacterium]
MHTIANSQIQSTLNSLHREASGQGFTILKGLSKGVFRKLRPEDMKDAYIAISREQGEFVYDLMLQHQSQHIVEFGTSFGISTLYLGAAAQATGGKVITTELLPEKCRVAQENFAQAGLQDIIELREGDALETLQDVAPGIDFLLLDGWNDLYLPLMKLLEPKLATGALIYTDNASFASARPFLNYINSNPDKYKSVRIQDNKGGSELTTYIGKR